jgi:hypothetical protein
MDVSDARRAAAAPARVVVVEEGGRLALPSGTIGALEEATCGPPPSPRAALLLWLFDRTV